MQRGYGTQASLIAATITTTTTTAPINTGGYSAATAYLNVTAVAGTTPSLTVQLQDSPDGLTWYNIPAGVFTAVTANAAQRLSLTGLGQFLRTVCTVTGTTPTFTVDLQAIGQ